MDTSGSSLLVQTLGDCIYIVIGSNVPYVLRPVPGGNLKLIGEAYVYGIVDGEWLSGHKEVSTIVLE